MDKGKIFYNRVLIQEEDKIYDYLHRRIMIDIIKEMREKFKNICNGDLYGDHIIAGGIYDVGGHKLCYDCYGDFIKSEEQIFRDEFDERTKKRKIKIELRKHLLEDRLLNTRFFNKSILKFE